MNISRLTLKQLEAFAAVNDAGSFRRAAELLATTQSNVSGRIAALEALLGVRLMHRNAGSVRLTERGEVLLVKARAVLGAADALLEAAGRRDAIGGRLRLGTTELVAATWLRAFLRRFRAVYPSVDVELGIDLSIEIARRLRDGECDLILMAGAEPASGPGDHDLGLEPFAWFAPPDIAKALAPSPSLADLMPHSILTHSRHTTAVQDLLAVCAREGLPTHRIVCSSSGASCLQMAEDGMGVALIPLAMARGSVAQGALQQIHPDWSPSPLNVLARFAPDRATPVVLHSVKIAKEVAAEDRDFRSP
ncbi:LysR family transcriptional regulator [Jannaschia sp. 2305UL9-9]|uniref:LysR family transcriptional regulator n=1 Tax=Jannaschia sp. 2305UL9-9 TaxID=3121638 RepID=UPI0035294685